MEAREGWFYVLMYSTKPTRNLQYNSLPLLAQAITRIIDKEGRERSQLNDRTEEGKARGKNKAIKTQKKITETHSSS